MISFLMGFSILLEEISKNINRKNFNISMMT